MFWLPKISHSFILNCCWITLQVLHHEGWKTCLKMEGKTNFLRRLKQFDGLPDWPRVPTLPILHQIYVRHCWLMTDVKEYHCHMRTKLQRYEDNQICLALFHGTGENVQLAPSEHWARHCPENGLYRRYWFIHSCKNQEKTVLSVLF